MKCVHKGKRVLIMLFCFFTTLSGFAHINGQVVLRKEALSLKQLFKTIEGSTDYTFFYKSNSTDFDKRINVQRTTGSVNEILEDALKGTGFTFQITGNDIVIKSVPASQNQSKKRTVKGKVLDENGQPVPGANVWLKETSIGVATDIEGNYTLTFEGNQQVLMASFVGYKNLEEIIGNRAEVNFNLVPESEKLDEVVVIGYGTQKKESVIGSISSVKSDKLKLPTGKLSSSLAGQLSGIVAVQRSGEPGSGSSFWIRGISTFGAGKDPLVLVDGIERSLDYVDPEDIESFSILKDATATAVYGVRGANGVIIVTTRKGEDGKPQITIRGEAGLVGPTRMPQMVDAPQFLELYNEGFRYKNGHNYYSEDMINKFRTGEDPDVYPNVNWFDELYKNYTSNQRVNANISGGGSIARYYISGSFYNEGSIFKEDEVKSYDTSINYNKFSFRSNVDINLHPSTILNVNLANIYETKNAPVASTDDIWGYSFSTPASAFPKRFSDGTFSDPSDSGSNPYNLLTQSGYKENYWNTAQALIGLTQDFSEILTDGLKANVKFSWDSHNSNEIKRAGSPHTFYTTGRDADGNLVYKEKSKGQEELGFEKSNGGSKTFYIEASATYSRVFAEKHRVGALFLYNQRSRTEIASNSEKSLPYRNQGIAGRVTYSYNDRYFGEFNVGYNGSENFSPGRRFGVFPAGAIGWMVSNENFFQDITHVIDVLKLKASYGVVGNDQIGGGRRFIYNPTIERGQEEDKDPIQAPGYSFGKNHASYYGLRLGDIANPNVGWEKSYKTNIGVELSFFRQLSLQVDYFREQREGIFLQRKSLPDIVGMSTLPYVNMGKVSNQGIDASMEYNKQIGEVMISARANFTYNRNKVIENDEEPKTYQYQSSKQKPIDQQWGLISDGLFTSQGEIDNSPKQTFGDVRIGDIKYKDVNGDGRIDKFDEVAIGRSTTPELTYGFGATVKWKTLDVSFLFQGIDHVTIQLSGAAIQAFSNGNMNRSNMYEDIYKHRWTEANPDPNALYPRMSIEVNPNNHRASTYWQRDGSFLRLKNAEIGFTIPKTVTEKIRLNSVRFYVSGVNLVTFSKFKLWDPETGGGQGQAYPLSRIFNFGVNVNF